ncbi:MAG: UDP-N-acetylglucosamine--N-acetylmuramyl-(pentapeptide) pyrophosphoryl-undecaprenol N-acetylglucosamine transferase [Cyclobacteriaceae bacterium]|jgi:UDP-N-acetylglucosamine--N-acetylmuramyl-(pentapeptide) pyrophosphoryl-undecaprenol N-acetylglucosamine transferase
MISGGGTGGHIYPAISIAQALKKTLADVEIRFVGAQGKMEMIKVPEAGFQIIGLWISGLQRRLTIGNLLFPIKLIASIYKSFRLLAEFRPDAVVGVGGYASGPLLIAAFFKRIPTLIQEQNAYAGLTNKWLAKYAHTVCVAHQGMNAYFPQEKIVVTGNPIRNDIKLPAEQRKNAFNHFELDNQKPTVLIIGGSLGARTINEAMIRSLHLFIAEQVQVIWQTGGYYHAEILERTKEADLSGVVIRDFIREMKYAYAVADVVISRSGALSIAELMLTRKPAIMVPSPNVAEDHQTKNAQALVAENAAVLVSDQKAIEEMVPTAIQLIKQPERRNELSENIARLAHPNAASEIVNEIIKLVA